MHPAEGLRTGLAWRVIVHVRDRDATTQTEWHLAACPAPHQASAHCPEGQQLIDSTGQPDGHCLVGGRCLLCDAPANLQGPLVSARSDAGTTA